MPLACRDALRQVDQAVGIQRVGAQFDLLEGELDAGLAPRLADLLPDLGQLFRAAELLLQEGPVRLARLGRVRVEEEGPPLHRHFAIGLLGAPQFQRRVEVALADEAPGADHVGNHIDCQNHFSSVKKSTPNPARASWLPQFHGSGAADVAVAGASGRPLRTGGGDDDAIGRVAVEVRRQGIEREDNTDVYRKHRHGFRGGGGRQPMC
jgi:hypothetical protein